MKIPSSIWMYQKIQPWRDRWESLPRLKQSSPLLFGLGTDSHLGFGKPRIAPSFESHAQTMVCSNRQNKKRHKRFFVFARSMGLGHEFLIRFAHKNSRPRLDHDLRSASRSPAFESHIACKTIPPQCFASGRFVLCAIDGTRTHGLVRALIQNFHNGVDYIFTYPLINSGFRCFGI